MKASEARALSLNERITKASNELENVYKSINSPIKKGDLDIFYYGSLSQETKEELTKDGYTLENITDPRDNRSTYRIAW